MKSDLELCIDIIRNMLVENKPITFVSKNYIEFKDKITEFIYSNKLENTIEWNNISNSMIYTSNQSLNENNANNILYNLEQLKRLNIANNKEMQIFKEYMHQRIIYVSMTKYFDGHYADAVESAFKEINYRCKKMYLEKTGVEEDGSSLMQKLFSNNKPLYEFENTKKISGRDVQIGYMNIFSGSMTAIRNPKAHENQSLDKRSAFKRLILASLLMDKIDDAIEYENEKNNSLEKKEN